MSDSLITGKRQFLDLCRHIEDAGCVAFDTEFVSEHTYRPDLGLMQFATDERAVAVDPYEIDDLAPWWRIMADDNTTVLVHGGQAEVRFCLTLFGERPRKLIDVQLAEGFCSGSYPVSYTSLVRTVLGERISGGETRTDWRRRPLSEKQLKYAIEDVRLLPRIWDTQRKMLKKAGRMKWLNEETDRYIDDLEAGLEKDVLAKLPGVNQLSRRELAVARELGKWREREATNTNKPPRRLLRDDLLVELAKRQPKTVKDLLRTRDMNRSNYKRSADEFLECIQRGLDLPEEELPAKRRSRSKDRRIDEKALTQILGMVLGHRCEELQLSKQIVATSDVLKSFIHWHIGGRKGEQPMLATGWRAEVCGDLMTDILEGRLSVRVGNPKSAHPLKFEPVDGEV